MNILVFNAGSSTLKASLFNESVFLKQKDGACLALYEASHEVTGGNRESFKKAALNMLGQVLKEGGQDRKSIAAVGHRIVHGGLELRASQLVDDQVIAAIEERIDLAPVHNPNALGCLDACRQFFHEDQEKVRQIAVFDTAFHRTIPEIRSLYPVPSQWAEDYQVRRFGFHGINHGYCTRRAIKMLPDAVERLIICHLGNGCSISAVLHGVSVNTSMGFTPMEGLMMGTRCGSIDPGIILHLIKNKKFTAEQLEEILNKQSGLLAVSGMTSDMRTLLTARKNLDERAVLAFDMFVDRLCHQIASFTASLGGLDALIFTGGIGEHSPEVRQSTVEALGYLGLKLDAQANENAVGDDTADAVISTKNSRVAILKVRAQEDLEIARQCFELVSAGVFSSWP